MVVGRVSSSPPNVRAEPTRVKLRNIFIICEGASELEYFQAIGDKGLYRDCVIVYPVDKFGPDIDDSNRLSLIQLADEYRQFQRNGQLHLRLFISMTIQSFLNDFKNKYYLVFGKSLKDIRTLLREEVRDDVFSNVFTFSDYTSNDIVTDSKGLAESIIKKCCTALDKDEDFYELDDSKAFPQSIEDASCESYVVFDRDHDPKHERGESNYEQWLQECSITDVKPVVTSPCFELWLWMHWRNTDYGRPSFKEEYAHEVKVKVIRKENPD